MKTTAHIVATLKLAARPDIRPWVEEYNPHSSDNVTDTKSARRYVKRQLKTKNKYSRYGKVKLLWAEVSKIPAKK